MTDKKKKKEAAKQGSDNIQKTLTTLKGETARFIFGIVCLMLVLFLTLAFINYFTTGAADQSLLKVQEDNPLMTGDATVQNGGGSLGALAADFFINKGFGIPTFAVILFLGVMGVKLMGLTLKRPLWKWLVHCVLIMVWSSLLLGFIFNHCCPNLFFFPGGAHGSIVSAHLCNVVGGWGLTLLLIATALIYAVIVNRNTIKLLRSLGGNLAEMFSKAPQQKTTTETLATTETPATPETPKEETEEKEKKEVETDPQPIVVTFDDDAPQKDEKEEKEEETPEEKEEEGEPERKKEGEPTFEVNTGETEVAENTPITIVVGGTEEDKVTTESIEPYNPTLDLELYHYPTLDLLKHYDDNTPSIDMEEQKANKERIIEVLRSFNVEIDSISATVGPTITLYEITPAHGVRIAKIRNLENDIALCLAAEGIRIIAPIPGKSTIGIEVPNAKKKVVPMWDIIASRKFQESNMELPMAIGKTITNEVYMADLAKAPHLLVAGATGQGKSVALNAIVTSLLYKKHPSELKFVIIDPKKVEFAIYAPIEKNFLAKLPDESDAIITDVTRVVQTLNSLCKEMDSRYDLLKRAGCRNIKEYNEKFMARKLVPDIDSSLNCHKSGHHYMPYIVVIIDEFGDLIMTAGKEVEFPIVRIAQLARAVGIHAIIATQRPTTNIITGSIKANFPARMALKVSAMIDSRTILDRSGAQQLIGRGDMLYLQGSEPVRVQCAFVDTPEVEAIAAYIDKQQSYPHAFILPEPDAAEGEPLDATEVDLKHLDPLFNEAAHLIVINQQGSTSLIQRKMNLGYNRAGRIMDQLEAAGIVGPNQGSKPRDVLCATETELEMKLSALQ